MVWVGISRTRFGRATVRVRLTVLSQTVLLYPVQNWSLEMPLVAFLQTPAPVSLDLFECFLLDPCVHDFVSSTGLGRSGNLIGLEHNFLQGFSLDKIWSPVLTLRDSEKSGRLKGKERKGLGYSHLLASTLPLAQRGTATVLSHKCDTASLLKDDQIARDNEPCQCAVGSCGRCNIVWASGRHAMSLSCLACPPFESAPNQGAFGRASFQKTSILKR